jgi:hypothetical protein
MGKGIFGEGSLRRGQGGNPRRGGRRGNKQGFHLEKGGGGRFSQRFLFQNQQDDERNRGRNL